MLGPLIHEPCEDVRAWVEQNLRFTPETSPNEPGPVSLARQPWMAEPLNCFLDARITSLHLVMGTQTGKTTLMLLGTAALIEHDPAPMIWAAPTDELSKRIVIKRLLPMLQANGSLARQLPESARAIANNTIPLASMPLYYTGAQVPAKLASIPAAYILMDEAAKYDHLRRNEAHPVMLLRERTKSFARKLTVEASTPNTEDNFFWRGYLASDQRKYFVPCPHCGVMQTLEFSRKTVRWDAGEDGIVTEASVLATARYVCPYCERPWTEAEKLDAMALGEWRPTATGCPAERRGYHLNSLYSAYVTTAEMAAEFWRSQHDNVFASDRLQNFANAWEARPYTVYAVRVTDASVRSLMCDTYRRGQIPVDDWHYIIVCYDPGERMTHWVATMVTRGGEMWVIDWGTLASFETDEEAGVEGAIVHLDKLHWGDVRPDLGYIDSGDWTMRVYQECERGVTGVLVPTKGTDAKSGAWGQVPVKSVPGLTLVTYSDYVAKRDLYDRIIAQGAGTLHLPNDADEELLDGLSGQQLEQTRSGGWRWKQVAGDHYGDCIKLARVSWWRNYRKWADEDAAAPAASDGDSIER